MVTPDALGTSIARVVVAANAQRGRELSPSLRDALNGLTALEGPAKAQKRAAVVAALAEVTSPSGAGFLAIWLGAGAEGGADPTPQTQPLLECFLRFTRRVKTDHEDFDKGEIDDELAIGLEYLGQGIVAHLSRDLRSLEDLQSNGEIIDELERVEAFSAGPMWILELARKVSGCILVLHGERAVGVRVEYRNISNCFHLFTLLQVALADTMPGARKVATDVLAVARGEQQAACSDEAWWHYGQPLAGPPSLQSSVFGEQNPREISAVDGQQVMLLWPPILASRTWDAGFFGPALHAAPAQVHLIASLPPEEVTMWRRRIGLPEGIA